MLVELDGVADDAMSCRKHAQRRLLAAVGGFALKLAQRDQASEVGFKEGHEMRMDVPAMGIASMSPAKHSAGEAEMLVELVRRAGEPIGRDRVGVGIDQDDT